MGNIILGNEEIKIVGACGMKIRDYNQIPARNRHIHNGQCFAYIKNSIKDGWHVVNFPARFSSK